MSDEEKGGNALLNSIAHPTIVNPLAAYQGAAGVANSIWQNRAWQAKQAAGDVFRGSFNPDGTPNAEALNRGLAANPNTGLAAIDTSQAGRTNAGDAQAQALKRAAYIGQVLPGLLKLPDDQLHAGLVDTMNRGRAIGIGTPESNLQIMANFSHDPAMLRQQLQNIQRGMQPPDQQQQTIYGKPGTVTGPGGVQQGTVTNPETGAVTLAPGPGVQQGLSPESGAVRVITGYDPKTGQPIYGPAESVAPPQMRPGSVGPGRLPPALRGPGAAGPDPSVVAAPDPRTGAQNEADQKAFLAEQSAIPTHQTAVQSLQNAQHALELTRTGGGTAGAHAIKSFLSAQGVATDGTDESAENYDKFAKYAIDYARQQAAGAGTNLQLEAAEHSNANPAMLAGANRAVLQTNIGRERQKIAMNMEAPDQKTGGGYIGHTSKYASNTDPRGFAVDAYTPEELTKLTGGMTDTERKKFWKTVGIADRLGLLNPRQ